jgi:hypothetical protein
MFKSVLLHDHGDPSYLKDNILPDEHASIERIIHVDKRYTLA